MPVDLLKEEQDRITRETANAGEALAATEMHAEEVGRNVERALDLLRGCGRLYREADGVVRRQMNHAFFERVEVDVDGVADTRLTPPFALLLEDKRLQSELKNPGRAFCGRGSSKSYLVGFRHNSLAPVVVRLLNSR